MKYPAGGFLIALTVMGSDRLLVTRDRIAVVCRCSVGAYGEALQGVRDTLGRDPEIFDLDKGGLTDLGAPSRRDPGKVYIAIGQESFLAAASLKPQVPIISTMILHGDVPPGVAAAEIDLDVPPRLLLQELRRLFPQYVRIGVLASGNADRAALLAAAKEAAVQLQLREVGGPPDLCRALMSFKAKVDLVLALPDNSLYNNATVQALILASLESGTPIVGFSAAFVRAGAAAGIFADFRDAGRQAGENALRLDLNHPQKAIDQPRKLMIAVNQRIVRLLGLNYDHKVNVTVFR
jgi:putative ABC transport system substrate-binding protein